MDQDHAQRRSFRIGIDVGGTFTKAVLIDNATRAIVARQALPTTHAHADGVAAGVVAAFKAVLGQSGVGPEEVVFIAHSTTQATNALLEGDVAKVGIVGMAGGAAAELAEAQVAVNDIEVAPDKHLRTCNVFLNADDLNDGAIREALADLAGRGAGVIVASAAFGVDNTASEEDVRRLAGEADLLTTCGHEITRLYGLNTRTRTAVINASILPRMNETAAMTEASVRAAGITAPLMIMRGDGGVMDIAEMRRRPATTMLSGPAASVAGALMHRRATDGIYFEVGGTSTNLGVIRNGRPTVAYAQVGGHETYVSSLDVRVVGVAGGSLVRALPGRLIDVGPRSAHIAGLAYAAFADPDAIVDPLIETFEPVSGDGDDHVAVRAADGTRYALTVTCAANVLGCTAPGVHAHGSPEAARRAFTALAQYLGVTVEAAALAVLDAAANKITPVVEALIKTYRLDADQCLLLGEGGGAGALVPFTAERLGLGHEISADAEVISSIGVALALVRDVVERIIPHPKPEDLQAIRQEAVQSAVRLGAHPGAVEVTVEIDRQTHRVTATATGSAELRVRDPSGAIHEREARRIAAGSMALDTAAVDLAAATSGLRVYRGKDSVPGSVRAIDWDGVVRVRRARAIVRETSSGNATRDIAAIWKSAGGDDGGNADQLEIVMLFDDHIVDLGGLETVAQITALAASELTEIGDDAVVAIIAAWPGAGRDR